MDADMNAEEQSVIDMIQRFAVDVLAPVAHEIDETGEFVSRHLKGMAELGLMGMNLPEVYGGAGLRPEIMFEGIAAIAGACGSTASMLTAHYLATDSIMIGGDDDLRQRYLPGAASGELLGAFALTEPRAGSNPTDMMTHAERENGSYKLNGVKHFISNGGVADFIVVYAKTDMDAGHNGISAFVVDKATPGFSAGPAEKTMGLKGGHIYEL
ncbi:MAG: acyl-CoA dehydrogenase, partial [Rhodospirillales bacterium]|nr:acyl-CoA dehydrogenase [Rhodospirillales bacterium]